MGVVYHARHLDSGHDVALKLALGIVSAEQTNCSNRLSREAAERALIREGVALFKLAHPNIVGYEDSGWVEGYRYLAMQHVVGRTVKALLQDGPIEMPRAINILTQVLFGLNCVHQNNLVHGDVSLRNIMVQEDGQAILLDFGLVQKRMARNIGGTPGYRSPEQRREEPIDERSDIYSAGIVGYVMLTGRFPFPGDSQEVLRRMESEYLPPLPPRFPPLLREAIARMTQWEVDRRYPNCEAAIADLQKIQIA
jgi:serine/threonine-protein kinase